MAVVRNVATRFAETHAADIEQELASKCHSSSHHPRCIFHHLQQSLTQSTHTQVRQIMAEEEKKREDLIVLCTGIRTHSLGEAISFGWSMSSARRTSRASREGFALLPALVCSFAALLLSVAISVAPLNISISITDYSGRQYLLQCCSVI